MTSRIGRPPLAAGVPGEPFTKMVAPGKWKAGVYVRDISGSIRRLERTARTKRLPSLR